MTHRTCSFPGCDGQYEAKGLCNKHYIRLRRKGDPADPGKKGPYFKPLEPRFWARINQQGPIPAKCPELGSCWEWLAGCTGEGYGEINIQGRVHLVHRVAYELLVGHIPGGLTIDHLCRNRACCNPSHLEVVTQRVNTLRGETTPAVNAAKTHCLRGHPFSEENTYLWRGTRQCRTCQHLRYAKWYVPVAKR